MKKQKSASDKKQAASPKKKYTTHIAPLTKEGPNVDRYFNDIVMSYVHPSIRLLDLYCSTGEYLQYLSNRVIHGVLAGIDTSSTELQIAKQATTGNSNTMLIQGDTTRLPFTNASFDMITCRKAPVSIREAFRVLDTNGWFIYKGTGPDYNHEIRTVFKDRYAIKPYEQLNNTDWKKLFTENAKKIGFDYFHIEDYTCYVYYNPGGLVEYLVTVPVVNNFNEKKDISSLKEIARKFRTDKGIRITRHYFLIRARK